MSGVDGGFHGLLAQDCEHTLSSPQGIVFLGKYSTNAWLQWDGSSPFSHFSFSVGSEAGGGVGFCLEGQRSDEGPGIGGNSCL